VAVPREKFQATPEPTLRWLTDVYMQVQKLRVAVGNRLEAALRQQDTTQPVTYIKTLHNRLYTLEKSLSSEMTNAVVSHPTWPWLSKVKGVGPTLATKLLGLISDISKAPTVSSLWRYAGYSVIDGKAERPVKGEKLHYNKRLKTTLYLIGDSFIKHRSPFRRIYDNAKRYYKANRPDWTAGHIHNAARRKMIKTFLACLWIVWREEVGLSTRPLYVEEKLGHTSIYRPEDFI